jgi:hypothetical protein
MVVVSIKNLVCHQLNLRIRIPRIVIHQISGVYYDALYCFIGQTKGFPITVGFANKLKFTIQPQKVTVWVFLLSFGVLANKKFFRPITNGFIERSARNLNVWISRLILIFRKSS